MASRVSPMYANCRLVIRFRFEDRIVYCCNILHYTAPCPYSDGGWWVVLPFLFSMSSPHL